MSSRSKFRAWTALVAAGLCATCAVPSSASAQSSAVTPEQAAELGKQAYDYGFPLLEFLRVRREMTSVECPTDHGEAPVNSFSNAGGFADASARTVVAPNTDTLYSISHLDLKRGPLVISHPDMGKRYYSFELLDPFTNVIDIPGLREDGGKAGSYVIRWKGHAGKGGKPEGARVIKSKYRRVWVIGRTLATDAKDQRKAQKLMAKYEIDRLNGKPARKFPKGCEPGEPITSPTPTDGPSFIAALNAGLAQNPPPKRDDPLLGQLAPLGVGPGLSPESAGLSADALAALYKGVSDEAAALPGRSRLGVLSEAQRTQGWLLPAANIGDYGTDYEFRALIAVVGLGANTPDEAIYPTGITDGTGTLYNAANRYTLTFPPGQAPPAKYFWSLTMYDSSGYLVDNPIDRYSVGPSHPPLVKRPDGSIVIAIQATDPNDPTVNWLPTPASGGFRLSLRLYGPSKAAQTGAWRPPGVVQVP